MSQLYQHNEFTIHVTLNNNNIHIHIKNNITHNCYERTMTPEIINKNYKL